MAAAQLTFLIDSLSNSIQ